MNQRGQEGASRREFLQRAGAAGALMVVGGGGLMVPSAAAAEDPSVKFFNGGAMPAGYPAGDAPFVVSGSGLGRDQFVGWTDQRRSDCGGGRRPYAINEVTKANNEAPRAGSRCLRFEARFNDPSNLQPDNAWHSEVIRSPVGGDNIAGKQGSTRFFGFSTYLPQNNWNVVTDKQVIFFQVKLAPEGSETPCIYGRVRVNKWEFVRNSGTAANPQGTVLQLPTAERDIVTDGWTDWVVEAYFRPQEWINQNPNAPKPYVRLWKKDPGQGVAGPWTFFGANCFNGQTNTLFQVQFGAYVDGWAGLDPQDCTPEAGQVNPSTRVLFHDEIRVANESGSYGAVVPR